MGTIQEEEEIIESSYMIHLNKGVIIYTNEKRHQRLATPDTELKIQVTFSLFLGLLVRQVAAILQLLASECQPVLVRCGLGRCLQTRPRE